ncbi:MAG: hypothetical protein COT74_13580 [Bdellovibrionales bacterium CG10_big_fil_rev_8_21_14_0_10_45_34]|nr:MAG: hypothetical protein COT74_13580 [Bdellovibrionales bacterium CG10_big_fil_rev_8_21_14_0_10_45_34]
MRVDKIAARLLEILYEDEQSLRWLGSTWDISALQKALSCCYCLLAVGDGSEWNILQLEEHTRIDANLIGGFVLWRQIDLDVQEIDMIAVTLKARRQAVATALLKELLARRPSFHLWLEVNVENLPAIRLYESLGFSRGAIRKGYYKDPAGGPATDALLMTRQKE